MINAYIVQTPDSRGRSGRAHLSLRGYRTLCGRWIAARWRRVDAPTRPLCLRCKQMAASAGYVVPQEPTP